MGHHRAGGNECKSPEVSHLGRSDFRLQDKKMLKDFGATQRGSWSQSKGWFTMKLHWGICEWKGKTKLWESSEQYVRVPWELVAPWEEEGLNARSSPWITQSRASSARPCCPVPSQSARQAAWKQPQPGASGVGMRVGQGQAGTSALR